ncbi:very-long-chain (3R)-3-hydroxyacyl- dehydratase [Raphidocelis subcapitata]|uniref:Very-long-chain (3R)-3-hydroxyacyl-CoA dehydratase n=1 Tax=Raphidocelis subcapitata TaxID=307507 RepID=A0A2V0NKZ4_9CHLO|nr:very-long-chain (3R)-3-hydroxyacyl- dehydratase [Raphidocelis subcapitata]|eukprot:GBF88046.1 very-long-chain (3R)-3-hydroxyacyl- dehydratase [Raphidocelis subcapitata]
MGAASRAYLVAYNAAQAAGWGVCLYQIAGALAAGGGPAEAYRAGAPSAAWMQCIAALEILHAATGLVPSNALNTFMQWLGRSNALYRIAQAIPELHANPAAALMLACWSLGEVVRYPWYAATAAGACPRWLTWLRYTAFIPIYPAGVAAEMVLMWRALPFIRRRGIFSVAMPNAANFAFDYATFITVVLAAYPYLWWGLYSTLLRQRRKKLGPAEPAGAGKRD